MEASVKDHGTLQAQTEQCFDSASGCPLYSPCECGPAGDGLSVRGREAAWAEAGKRGGLPLISGPSWPRLRREAPPQASFPTSLTPLPFYSFLPISCVKRRRKSQERRKPVSHLSFRRFVLCTNKKSWHQLKTVEAAQQNICSFRSH